MMISLSLGSCCKLQDSAGLKVEFENFDFSTLDSVLLISTNRDNIQEHQDTLLEDLRVNHYIIIPVFDSGNSSYIIKNNSPAFEHTITAIDAERTKGFGCAGKKIKFSFQLDGTTYEKERKHTVTIKP